MYKTNRERAADDYVEIWKQHRGSITAEEEGVLRAIFKAGFQAASRKIGDRYQGVPSTPWKTSLVSVDDVPSKRSNIPT